MLFLVVMYRFTEKLLGRLVALLAVAFLLTRTDMMLLALRAMFDLPFYLLIFSAALLELGRPRRGWPVLALLALAGLLRPEAWLLAGVYWLWLVPAHAEAGAGQARAARGRRAGALARCRTGSSTGEPLYSLTSTREVSGQFGRNRGLGDAIVHVPRFAGGNDTILTVGVGGLGLLLAVYLLRRRAAVPLALGGLGVLTFLIIAAAGLSVIPRYMTIPSLLLTLCIAGRARRLDARRGAGRRGKAAIGIAIFSLAILGWRAPCIARDYDALRRPGTLRRGPAQGPLHAARRAGRGRAAAVVPPAHRPDALGDAGASATRRASGRGDVEASIAQSHAPHRGTQLIGRYYNFEPGSGRSTTVAAPRVSVRKRWSQKPAPGFEKLASTARWTLYGRCGS